MPRKAEKRRFGQVRRLPSGRYQARYTGPDLQRHNGPTTYTAKVDAEAWLLDERRLIESGRWTSPAHRKEAAATAVKVETFSEFAYRWVRTRRRKNGAPLADRTRDSYLWLLDRFILPTFGDLPLAAITVDAVDRWHDALPADKATACAQAYSLLRTILNTAVSKRLIDVNPCRIVGAGNVDREREIRPASPGEVKAIVDAMPEGRRLMVILAAQNALRIGELCELRRSDVNTEGGYIEVRRSVVRVREIDADGNARTVRKTKAPKTKAGRRRVYLAREVMAEVRKHLLAHAAPGDDGLLFPARDGGQLVPSTVYGRVTTYDMDGNVVKEGHGYHHARRVAGRDDLRFHDLRHTALTNMAVAGATIAELQDAAGHTTPSAAMRYQHARVERMATLAQTVYDATAEQSS